MICYFASRRMEILALASTQLKDGLHLIDDKKTEDIDSGQDVFSGRLCYGSGQRENAEAAAEVGNYILKKSDVDEFYTIIESEFDPLHNEIYFYAEAAGLDLIGEICEPFEASAPMTLAQYASKWLYDTGFEVGVDESGGAVKTLKWEDSETTTARILSTAEQFGCEVSFRYDIERLSIKHKYIDFHTRRGRDGGIVLRRGRDFEDIRIKKSIADIATALRVTGGTPDGAGIRRDLDETFTWVKFSEYANGLDDEDSASMQDDSDGMQFIGTSPGHATDEESENPDDYAWGMIRKATGIYAVPSVKGYRESNDIGGRARYTWVMFATDENGSMMSDQPTDRSYVGLALHKTSETKGALASQYTWYPMEYAKGCRDIYINPGTGAISEGNGLYTWMKFADDTDGTGMSNSPAGKAYIGLAFHRAGSTESTTASDYEWHEISLGTTAGGVALFSPFYPGLRQGDGSFLWYKFAADGYGSDMSGAPNNRPYLGIAYDQASCIQSNDPADYEWSLIDADESSEVTLRGMNYNDGDFWVDSKGRLRSEEALARWSRYVSPDETGADVGHIVADFESDATNQDQLLDEAITELKRRREPETTYEIDLIRPPDGLGIGDTVSIVDAGGGLYLTARVLKITTQEEKGTHTVVLGDYRQVSQTVSDQIAKLAAQQKESERRKYTWVVYADSATGDNIRTNPMDAAYMGVAYNKPTLTPDLTDPFEYTWSLIGAGENGILSMTWYYMLKNEGEDAPEKPTDDPPAGWDTTEPTYTEGSANVLYTVMKTAYTDGTCEYSDVSVSSSYTAAKAAYIRAIQAQRTATNYLAADSTGIMVANMTAEGTQYTPSNVPSGTKNTFINEDSFQVRDGTDVLASFGETTQIGQDGTNHQVIDSTGIQGVNTESVPVFNISMDGANRTTLIRNEVWNSEHINSNPKSITITYGPARGSTTPLPVGDVQYAYRLEITKSDGTKETSNGRVDFGIVNVGENVQKTVETGTGWRVRVTYQFVNEVSFNTQVEINTTGIDTSAEPYVMSIKFTIRYRYVYSVIPSPAFTLGTRFGTPGAFSGAIGENLSTQYDNAFACGKNNNDNEDYALMVGNGSSGAEVSNAFVITWDGNQLFALDGDAASGTDAELYSAISALGWESEVIV